MKSLSEMQLKSHFYKQCVLPELLDRWYTKSQSLLSRNHSESKLLCYKVNITCCVRQQKGAADSQQVHTALHTTTALSMKLSSVALSRIIELMGRIY